MILFDTETTGLVKPYASPLKDQPRMIEYAFLKLDDKKPAKEIARLTGLINPGIPLPNEITDITGLKDDDVKGAPSFSRMYPEIAEFCLGERHLVGHNVKFDVDILNFDLMSIQKAQQFPWPPNHICTVVNSMQVKGFRLRQEQLYEHLTGEVKKGTHRAMADVEDLWTIVLLMMEKSMIKLV